LEHEEAREAWVRNGIGEIDTWCRHISLKVRSVIEIERGGEGIPMIERAETIFDICAVINRLAHIAHRRATPIGGSDLTTWLATNAGWPVYVAKAFWYCVRNPTMHLGRSWLFADHDRKHEGVHLFGDITGSWSFRGPDHTIPPTPAPWRDEYDSHGQGWSSSRGGHMPESDVAMWGPDAVSVSFFMPGVLAVLGLLRNSVLDGLRTATHEDLERLVAVNASTGFLYSETQPPENIVELDISDLTH
jgi:hypothetical protein